MTEARDGDSCWAWDTAPTDGSHPGPVYIGDMEDWSHEETMKRRDTFRDPWGGVWTEPLTPGATKAKWGTRNFKTGRYRCCEDLDDCGVFVSVSQGPNKAWCFQRQWGYGKNNSSAHNQDSCRNKSNYTGTTRFHNIVVNEIYGMLRNSKVLGGKRIESTKKERTVTGLGMFEPDVYVEFEDESWFAIEVILTSAPDREKHDKFGTNLIEINLNELECLDNDREFSRWIQQGGVSELLLAESTLEQRTQRWEARENKWKRKDELEFREAFDNRMGVCASRFGFDMDIRCDSITELEQIDHLFEQELFTRLNNAQQQANHLKMEIEQSNRMHAATALQELEAVAEVLEHNTPATEVDTTSPNVGQMEIRNRNLRRAKSQPKSKKTHKTPPMSKRDYVNKIRGLTKTANNTALPAKRRREAEWDLVNLKCKYKTQNSKKPAGKISSRGGARQNR